MNQIEEIKKLPKYKINTEVVVGNNHYISNIETINYDAVIKIIDNQPDFKSAFEELKNIIKSGKNNVGQIWVSRTCETLTKNVEKLEQKYNLGGE